MEVTPAEPQRGVVRWSEGDQMGLTFNRALPLSLLVGWLQQHRDALRAASGRERA